MSCTEVGVARVICVCASTLYKTNRTLRCALLITAPQTDVADTAAAGSITTPDKGAEWLAQTHYKLTHSRLHTVTLLTEMHFCMSFCKYVRVCVCL